MWTNDKLCLSAEAINDRVKYRTCGTKDTREILVHDPDARSICSDALSGCISIDKSANKEIVYLRPQNGADINKSLYLIKIGANFLVKPSRNTFPITTELLRAVFCYYWSTSIHPGKYYLPT